MQILEHFQVFQGRLFTNIWVPSNVACSLHFPWILIKVPGKTLVHVQCLSTYLAIKWFDCVKVPFDHHPLEIGQLVQHFKFFLAELERNSIFKTKLGGKTFLPPIATSCFFYSLLCNQIRVDRVAAKIFFAALHLVGEVDTCVVAATLSAMKNYIKISKLGDKGRQVQRIKIKFPFWFRWWMEILRRRKQSIARYFDYYSKKIQAKFNNGRKSSCS